MKIGDAISSIEFSNSEKDRIGDAILSGKGLIYEIVATKAQSIQDQEFWRHAQRRFKITGFRDGHPSARTLVVRKAIDSLKVKPGHTNEDIWPLYRMCARYYVIDDLSELNGLLLNEEFEASEGSLAEQIFRGISEKLPLYGASFEEVRQLYDLWGFERISDLNSIFSNEKISTSLIRRMILTETDRTKREIAVSITKLSSELQHEGSERRKDSAGLTEKLEGLDDRIDSSVAILRTEFQNLAASVMQKKVHEIGETIRKMAEKATPQAPKSQVVEAEALVTLQNRIDKIAKKVQRHEEALAETNPHNQLTAVTTTGARSSITAETVFRECLSVCSKQGFTSPTLSLVSVLMRILKKSRIVITDRPNIILGILSSVVNVECRRVSASPLWISPLDWADGVKFLQEKTKPHVLVLSDFDVAIQESYLVPALGEWIDASEINPFSRVVLVPSKPSLSAVSGRVLEMSSVLEFDGRWTSRVNGKPEAISVRCDSKDTVEPTELLGHSVTPNIEFESHLKRFALNSGVALPSRLATQFVNVYTALNNDLPDNDAGAIALEIAVLPWVRSARGMSVGRIVEESLKVAFAGG